MNFLPVLALNHDPLDISFPSSWDYRREPLAPTIIIFFIEVKFMYH
jgi:hypothetical protein